MSRLKVSLFLLLLYIEISDVTEVFTCRMVNMEHFHQPTC